MLQKSRDLTASLWNWEQGHRGLNSRARILSQVSLHSYKSSSPPILSPPPLYPWRPGKLLQKVFLKCSNSCWFLFPNKKSTHKNPEKLVKSVSILADIFRKSVVESYFKKQIHHIRMIYTPPTYILFQNIHSYGWNAC